jgi:parvulin-like peptidyl-prolyl isomerase
MYFPCPPSAGWGQALTDLSQASGWLQSCADRQRTATIEPVAAARRAAIRHTVLQATAWQPVAAKKMYRRPVASDAVNYYDAHRAAALSDGVATHLDTPMTDLVRINDEITDSDGFINNLKLGGRFDTLLEEFINDRLVVHAAKKQGVVVTPKELQDRADQLRRVRGLHRAADMKRYLDSLKVTVQQYEDFIAETLYYEKMMEQVLSDAAVDKYFRLNSPKFDSIDVSHILVESAGMAKEIIAILEDEPEQFGDLAREHSIADTRKEGGSIGRIMRGSLQSDVESKVFHAKPGTVLGPFPSPDGSCFEIFMVNDKRPATFDDEVKNEIRRVIKEEWIAARAQENRVDVL